MSEILRKCNAAELAADWPLLKEHLGTLDSVKQLNKANHEANRGIIWFVLSVSAIFLLLAFIPCRTAEVAIELKARKIEFSIARDGSVFQQIPTTEVVISNARSKEDLTTGDVVSLVDSAGATPIEPIVTNAQSVAFDQMPRNNVITLSMLGRTVSTAVRVDSGRAVPSVRLNGVTDGVGSVISFSSPRELLVSATLPSVPIIELIRAEVKEIRFIEADVHPQAAAASFSAYSPIQGGHVDMLDVENNVTELRKGDSVRIDGATGHLSVDADGDTLSCRFVGVVNTIAAGRFNHERPLKPTVLQWLRSKYSFLVALSILVTLLPMIYGGLTWINSAFRH